MKSIVRTYSIPHSPFRTDYIFTEYKETTLKKFCADVTLGRIKDSERIEKIEIASVPD